MLLYPKTFAGLPLLFFYAGSALPRAILPALVSVMITLLLEHYVSNETRVHFYSHPYPYTVFANIVGFALEAFKTSGAIQSWAYPDFAYTKLLGVPLFAGFMYAAVGSYIIQAWRILDVRIIHHPVG